MVKSTINDWLVCQPNGGSMVAKKEGLINCEQGRKSWGVLGGGWFTPPKIKMNSLVGQN